jgi:hypothetical protein
MDQEYRKIALKYSPDKINFDILFDSGNVSNILDELKYILSNNISFDWNKYAPKIASIPGEKCVDLKRICSMGYNYEEKWYYKTGPFHYIPDEYKTYDLWVKALRADLCYIEHMPKKYMTPEIEKIVIENYSKGIFSCSDLKLDQYLNPKNSSYNNFKSSISYDNLPSFMKYDEDAINDYMSKYVGYTFNYGHHMKSIPEDARTNDFYKKYLDIIHPTHVPHQLRELQKKEKFYKYHLYPNSYNNSHNDYKKQSKLESIDIEDIPEKILENEDIVIHLGVPPSKIPEKIKSDELICKLINKYPYLFWYNKEYKKDYSWKLWCKCFFI